MCAAADELRAQVNGETVSYVVNRNINYTNICYFRCQFCAFSKGKLSENLRGKPYNLALDEIARADARGVGRAARPKCACRAASIPAYTGATYSRSVEAVKRAVPEHARPRLLAARRCSRARETLGISARASSCPP